MAEYDDRLSLAAYPFRLICKEVIDPDYLKRAMPYLKALMRSFVSRHEEKEAICSMLLDELVLEVVPGNK